MCFLFEASSRVANLAMTSSWVLGASLGFRSLLRSFAQPRALGFVGGRLSPSAFMDPVPSDVSGSGVMSIGPADEDCGSWSSFPIWGWLPSPAGAWVDPSTGAWADSSAGACVDSSAGGCAQKSSSISTSSADAPGWVSCQAG